MKTDDDDLADLLTAARSSTPAERIGYRDRISAHGKAAIAALIPWLTEPTLRSFAIRTITKAGQLGQRDAAVEALRTVPASAPRHVLDDVDAALTSLGARRSVPSVAASAPDVPSEIDDALYAFIVAAARNGRYVTYTEAGEIVGLTMRNPHHRRVIGQRLGAISAHEVLQGRPMLSSIVVNKDQHSKPGQGFYQEAEELHLKQVGEDSARCPHPIALGFNSSSAAAAPKVGAGAFPLTTRRRSARKAMRGP